MAQPKKRLDARTLELYPNLSRAYIQSLIMQGKVSVNGSVVMKTGSPVKADAEVVVSFPEESYVSRAGYKLAGALDAFKIDVSGKVCVDAGISTGGFTDCLLRRGVARVYGIDVGYGLVHESIRRDSRVILMERTNLRLVHELPESVDFVTLDLSFISLTKIFPVVDRLLKPGGELLALIKPQFEAGYAEVSRGEGVISDPAVHQRVIQGIVEVLQGMHFTVHGVVPSTLPGGSGNQEFLVYANKKIS